MSTTAIELTAEVQKLRALCREQNIRAHCRKVDAEYSLQTAQIRVGFALAFLWIIMLLIFSTYGADNALPPGFLSDADQWVRSLGTTYNNFTQLCVIFGGMIILPVFLLMLFAGYFLPNLPIPGFLWLYRRNKKAKHDYLPEANAIVKHYEGADGFLWKFAGIILDKSVLTTNNIDVLDKSFSHDKNLNPDMYVSTARRILELIDAGKTALHEEVWEQLQAAGGGK
jgi:hypothetical protein